MILQALYEYYQRKAERGDIALIGFEKKQLPFIIVIDNDGNFKYLKDTRTKEDKKLVAKSFTVPQSKGRSGANSSQTTFLLWDHYGYVLGCPKNDAPKDRNKRHKLLEEIIKNVDNETVLEWFDSELMLKRLDKIEIDEVLINLENIQQTKEVKELSKNLKDLLKALDDGQKQFSTFNKMIEELPENIQQLDGIKAIKKFYENNEYLKVFEAENWLECINVSSANMSFQLEGETELILHAKEIKEYQQEIAILPDNKDDEKSLCLITGKEDYISAIHTATPILGGQATGKLVGFQKSSGYDSYGKEQGFNAPIGKNAQIAYTTALNTLSKSDENRVFLGDTTIMFWSEKETMFEQQLPLLFRKSKDDEKTDNPDAEVGQIKQLYQSIFSGKFNEEGDKNFFVLGLAPNAARVSVRYWLTGKVSDFAKNIKQHFDDLEIIKRKNDDEYFALSSMLSHTVLDYKLNNLAPNMMAQVTEAVLNGTPYPQSLFHSTIRRIRAEQHVTRVRASILKACINRNNRFYKQNKEEITVALDVTNTNPAYLLGRLFAVLEKIQKETHPGINATIRERYYGAFSTTPVTVFQQLMKLKNHHLAKMSNVGRKIYFENMIGEIINGLEGSGLIPRQFSLEEQGRFAIGYYHQNQSFYTKKEETENLDNLEN